MSENGTNPMHRREFIQAGAAATAVATTLAQGAAASQVAGEQAGAAKKTELPCRVLGKTGAEVTIVNAGTWRAPDSLDR
ncbi:MAG: aldo/keto reductase, partial [Isosphaeraceae bacterium]